MNFSWYLRITKEIRGNQIFWTSWYSGGYLGNTGEPVFPPILVPTNTLEGTRPGVCRTKEMGLVLTYYLGTHVGTKPCEANISCDESPPSLRHDYHHSIHTSALTTTRTSVGIQCHPGQARKQLRRRMGNLSKLHHYLYGEVDECKIGLNLHTGKQLLWKPSLIWLKIRRPLPWLASEFIEMATLS